MTKKNNRQEAKREEFPDGSPLVTYQDGSMLIVESKLAKGSALRETRVLSYVDPPPPPDDTKLVHSTQA